jgi:membrane fusion protein, multidrug efflux system
MKLPRRVLGFGSLFLVIAVLAAGVYFRLSAKEGGAEADPTAAESDGVDPNVSASEQFDTSMPIAVTGVPVVRDTLIMAVTAQGLAASVRQTTLYAQVEGQVLSIAVGENTPVGGGAPLVTIDSRTYELDLADAQARLQNARNQYREITLFDRNIEDPRVRASRDSAARAKANIDGAEIAVKRAEMNLARAKVVAPFAGRVANLKVVPDQYVRSGDELMTIIDIDPIKVEVEVLEAGIGQLAIGRNAAISFGGIPGRTFTGRIQTINPILEDRFARATVLVSNPGGLILPGMFARARLDARRYPDRILVPREAVVERERRTLVFLFEGEGTTGAAMWQYVATGLDNGTYIEIIADPNDPATRLLEPGEIVLIDGHTTLTHAAPVRLVSDVAAEGGRPR